MKITDMRFRVLKPRKVCSFGVSTYPVRYGLCQILTDEGIEGDYITSGWEDPNALANMFEDIRDDVIRQDPYDREKIEKTIGQKWRVGPALAVLDICLWDIAGKAMNLPVYKLLGAHKDKIPAYVCTLGYETIEEYVNLALECKNRDYRAFKIHSTQDWRTDIDLCKAIREAVGAEMTLMLDPIFGYDREGALKVGREIEKLDFLYYEDPIPSWDIDGLEGLCRSLDIDIVVGEDIQSLQEYNEYIRRHATDVLRTGPTTSCGITGMMKIAHLAEAYGMKCEPFNYGSMLAQAASFHVELANENCRFYEMPVPEGIFDLFMKDVARIDHEGYVHAPIKPGLGYDIDWDEVEKNTLE